MIFYRYEETQCTNIDDASSDDELDISHTPPTPSDDGHITTKPSRRPGLGEGIVEMLQPVGANMEKPLHSITLSPPTSGNISLSTSKCQTCTIT